MFNLKEIREKRGLSQAELSRLSGVNASTIGMLEAGAREYPRLDTAQKLANALHCRLDDLQPDIDLLTNDDKREGCQQ